MLVLITGLHVLRGPQPSLIKTLIRGRSWARPLPDGFQVIIMTLSTAAGAIMRRATRSYQSTARGKGLLIMRLITVHL